MRTLGDAGPRARTGVKATVAQHDDAIRQMVRKVLVAGAHDDRVSRHAPSLDPSRHSRVRAGLDRDVDEVQTRLVDARTGREIVRDAMIARSASGNGAFLLTEPAHVPAFVRQQAGGAKQQRGLAGPARAQERQRLTGRHSQADVAQDVSPRNARSASGGEPLGDTAKLERDDHPVR